ncbi:MAG TPA: hypothetical protein VFA20_30655 [Myxococcaceae bacterium]|nr:hypothetical protein [Myxococcaceae bacterium]
MRRAQTLTFVFGLVVATAAAAVPLEYPEGALRGLPEMRDLQGRLLGRGNFAQWVDGDGIHVKVTYDQLNGDRIEEATTLSTEGGDLAQRVWSWQRASGGQVVERYAMDFDAGEGRTLLVRNGKREERRERVPAVKGQTFAGIGFNFALKNIHQRLVRGERVVLEGVAFTPRPRKAKVLVSSRGVETVRSGGRSLRADHLVIHPQVPQVAKLFINVPDSHLWFLRGRPPGFVRAEVQMQSLGVVRIDAVSGDGTPPSAARGKPER